MRSWRGLGDSGCRSGLKIYSTPFINSRNSAKGKTLEIRGVRWDRSALAAAKCAFGSFPQPCLLFHAPDALEAEGGRLLLL